MAKKKETNPSITWNGEKYDLIFNLNVMEEIQEKYGSVEKWGELVEEAEEPKAKDIKFGFTAMLNEGIDIYNETSDEKREFFTEKQVGRIISQIGLQNAAHTLNTAVVESTKSDEKNA